MTSHTSSIQIQTVLFHTPVPAIERALTSLDRAARLALDAGRVDSVRLAIGDSSASPLVSDSLLEHWRGRWDAFGSIHYDFFGANLGTSAGHNRLAEQADVQALLVTNPDVVAAPRTLQVLCDAMVDPLIAVVEAKQLPIEHPKDYDPRSGATSWCSMAFAIVRTDVFRQLHGFDAQSFFLYGDDVDFSWRVRQLGYGLIYQPGAAVFHDKRLTSAGVWKPTEPERYYSALAALLLPYKWSRDDLMRTTLRQFERDKGGPGGRAAAEFRERERTGRLPERLDPQHRIAEFVDGAYATHRFGV